MTTTSTATTKHGKVKALGLLLLIAVLAAIGLEQSSTPNRAELRPVQDIAALTLLDDIDLEPVDSDADTTLSKDLLAGMVSLVKLPAGEPIAVDSLVRVASCDTVLASEIQMVNLPVTAPADFVNEGDSLQLRAPIGTVLIDAVGLEYQAIESADGVDAIAGYLRVLIDAADGPTAADRSPWVVLTAPTCSAIG